MASLYRDKLNLECRVVYTGAREDPAFGVLTDEGISLYYQGGHWGGGRGREERAQGVCRWAGIVGTVQGTQVPAGVCYSQVAVGGGGLPTA